MSRLKVEKGQYGQAHCLPYANIKGGTGKSTAAITTGIALWKLGIKVHIVDVDEQGSISRYIENRASWLASVAAEYPKLQERFPMPVVSHVRASNRVNRDEAEKEEIDRFGAVMMDALMNNDVVIVDTPGNNSHLARLTHAVADTIVSPVSDSALDLDLFARYDPNNDMFVEPSIYTEVVWECSRLRNQDGFSPPDWVVAINRFDPRFDVTKGTVWKQATRLANDAGLGFRVVKGLGERRIFRELFQRGHTIFDLDAIEGQDVRAAEIRAAQEEAANFLEALNLPLGREVAA